MNHAYTTVAITALCMLGCAADSGRDAARASRGDNAQSGSPNGAEPEDESTETCTPDPTRLVSGWTTYARGDFSFQTPAAWVVTESLEGNTDPSISPYFAKLVLGTTPLESAAGFSVIVAESTTGGTPADRLAQLAEDPQGTPTQLNTCGLIASMETTYRCDSSVDWTTTCKTRRGFSIQWQREIYQAGRTFFVECAATGMPDEEATCAAVLASVTVGS